MEEFIRGNINFLNFTKLSKEKYMMILDWRNLKEVRSMMRTNTIISLEEHLAFLQTLKKNDKSFYWLVLRKERPCAVVYLHVSQENNLDLAEWGYYLSPDFLGTGIGLEVGFESIHIFFEEFNLTDLRGYVKKENLQNLQLQQILGFVKKEEVRSDGLIEFAMLEKDYQKLEKEFKNFRRKLIRH